ncbi:unnamed protein product [Symbiodinium necroappetens]|uniref:Uncharacterized protein n=1 Tax=Symbiodinium necroappetens TaxID=1628268 RepID=A0A812KP04_9DINO|nr:unnamed protein product [Symbiodinium necroappetens]
MAVKRCASAPALGRRITARNVSEARMLRVLDHQWERKACWLNAQQQRLDANGTREGATQKSKVDKAVVLKERAQSPLRRSDTKVALSRPLSSAATRNSVESVGPQMFSGERPGSAIVRSPSDGLPAKLEERIPKAVSRIAQGLQVALLGANAGEMRKQEIKGVPLKKILFEPYEADVCRIFRHFLHLKDVEEDRTAANKERHRQRLVEWGKLEPDEPFQTDDEEISRDPLSRVSWATFFRWVEQEASFGVHPESRRACSALFRGARLWLRACASNAQRSEGLSLGLLLLWAYPTVSNRVVAELLAWIGAHELEKLRQEPPRLIDDDERKQLERIFQSTYAKGRAFVTVDDIAGGDFRDKHTHLHTLVDVALAREVFGDAPIDFPKFLEHMCEYGCQGHVGVSQVTRPSGLRLTRCRRPAFRFWGWLSSLPSETELAQLRMIDALELEVKSWKSGAGY